MGCMSPVERSPCRRMSPSRSPNIEHPRKFLVTVISQFIHDQRVEHELHDPIASDLRGTISLTIAEHYRR